MAKILLIEDAIDIAKLVRDWLEAELHLVEIVGDGLAGMHRLITYPYDLIILDLQLPGMSGIDICRQFRQRPGATPILMLTANPQSTTKKKDFSQALTIT